MDMEENQITFGNNTQTEEIIEFSCGTVCVVDDDPASLTLIGDILSRHGFTVLPTADGDVAIKTIKAEQPDLVLLDIMLSPEVDGYDICKILKSDESTQEIPVIFISALDQTIDKVKAFEVGGVDYITKPFHIKEVLARVQNQIQQHHIQKQLSIQYKVLQKEIKKRIKAEKELEQTNKQLELLITIDPLTGLNNRRHFDKHYQQEWKRMIREKESMALLLCDIDDFDEYNMQNGALAGDLILQKLAKTIRKVAKRPGDIVARWGEDEFIFLLPRTDLKGAETLAKQIKKKNIALTSADSTPESGTTVTLSIGIASTIPAYGIPREILLSNASEALTQSKRMRNGIVCFDDMEK